jgi:hypothetical protein
MQKGEKMSYKTIRGLALGTIFALSVSGLALAQSDTGAKQDMKNAGHETTHAAKDAGNGVKKGTEKGYHKTTKETKKAAHSTENATKEGYHKTTDETKKAGHELDPNKH